MTAPAQTDTTETPAPPADTAPPAEPQATAPAVDPSPETTPPAEPSDDAKTYDASYVKRIRTEAANHRTAKAAEAEARQAAETALAEQKAESEKLSTILAGLNKVLNPDAPTEEAPDPAKLAEQLSAAEKARGEEKAAYEAQIRGLQVKAALPAIASRLKLDPDLTHAVLASNGELGKLDPSADTFAADLESAATAAADTYPSLRVAPVVTATGTEPTGRSGGTDQLTREQLQGMTSAEITKAQSEGRLKNLLGG